MFPDLTGIPARKAPFHPMLHFEAIRLQLEVNVSMSNRSTRRERTMGLMEPTLQDCDECGAPLGVGTDRNGFSVEWCTQGCFAARPVQMRRPPCPECDGENWSANDGCRDCGHEWVTRACPWDGTVAIWRPQAHMIGFEVEAA